MPRLALLLAALVLAGCAAPAAPSDPSPQTPGIEEPSCESATEELLSWRSPEGADGAQAEENFTVASGTRTLDVAWTPPTSSAGSYHLEIVDPAGQRVFEQRLDQGATVAGGSVSSGGFTQSTNVANPPPPGSYVFRYAVEGAMQGASVVVTATLCRAPA
jgi:hypothetical protein